MGKELNTTESSNKFEIFQYKSKDKLNIIGEYFNYFNKYENSCLIDYFYSFIMYSYKCMCGYVSYTFQKFFDISLMIPNIRKALFNNFVYENFKSEILEWINPCENCWEIFSHRKE